MVQYTLDSAVRTITCVLADNELQVYTGIARVHPEDIFDENFGRELAFSRAIDKYLNHRYKQIIQQATKIANEDQYFIERMVAKHFKKDVPSYLADLMHKNVKLNPRYYAAPREGK